MDDNDYTTSNVLKATLDELDEGGDFRTEEEAANLRKWRQFVADVHQGLQSSAGETPYRLLGELGESIVISMLDEYFSRYFVHEVPRIVRRFMKFQPIFVQRLPGGSSNIYLREASLCYAFGLYQAAVTLARSALEQGLREKVPHPVHEWMDLKTLIDEASRSGVLDSFNTRIAHQVRRWGNQVVHQKPCDESRADEALTTARKVLEVLFGPSQ